jgi:hypothetical protein
MVASSPIIPIHHYESSTLFTRSTASLPFPASGASATV